MDNGAHEITKVVWQIDTMEVLERHTRPYDGPWELAKGGNSQQQMQLADKQLAQQNALMQQFLALQKGQLDIANPVLKQIIQAGGMLPQQEAAMRTQAIQGLGEQYKGLEGQLSQQLTARGLTGGDFAGGGGIAKSFGELGALEAGQQSSLLNQIQLAKGQGLNTALGTVLGEGGMLGSQATSFGGQAGQALGAGVQAGQAADQASTGFWGSLFGGLAGLGGSALTKYCWVAAEFYGWYTPEWFLVRDWVFKTWWMRPFAAFYFVFGERWAKWIQSNSVARRMTKKLFDTFLRLADG